MCIYNLGSLNIDYVYSVEHFVSAGETLSSDIMEIFPGGKGLNQSVALAHSGAKVIHGGLVGDGGEFLTEKMALSGVDISRIKRTDGSNGHAIIQVNRDGQNCILLHAGSNHKIDRKYIEDFLADAEENDILLLQNEISSLDDAFEIAGQRKMRIAFNPSPFHEDIKRLPLRCVKWFFCNEIEGEALFGSDDPETMKENFLNTFPESVLILTLGSRGSMYISKEKSFFQPCFKVHAVDTTAAGDAFTGYFISAVSRGESDEYAMEIASKAASVTVSRKGASDSIPYFKEIGL
ncbi:MAG: ribokinase [Eubacteriales bacterium]